MPDKIIETSMYYRMAELDRATLDEKKRTVTFSMSSEFPVQRWDGKEILDHGNGSVDLSFLNSGNAPLLKDHDRMTQTGVIESARMVDRRLVGIARFGSTTEAQAEFQEVVDGIRSNVSLGYRVNKIVLEEDGDEGSVYRVMEWTPLEVSFVAIPSDPTVGVGRDAGVKFKTQVIKKRSSITMEKKELSADAIREMLAIGGEFNFLKEAKEYIDAGKSLEEFRSFTMSELARRDAYGDVVSIPPSLGLSHREIRQFSLMKICRAVVNPSDRKAQEDASYEFEVSASFQKIMGRSAKGIATIPPDILAHDNRPPHLRDLSVQTSPAGGYLVGEKLLFGSFIEKLDNAMVTVKFGATILRDLTGDIAIPKSTGRASSYWVRENRDITESDQTFGQVTLRPKTVGAFTDITRRLMIQSGMDVENLIQSDLAITLGLAIDAAALNGSGSGGEPPGIMQTNGIGSVTLDATNTPTWGDIVDIESAVAVDNALAGNLGYTCNAVIAGNMKQTAKETGYPTYILEGNTLNGHPFFMSNMVPAQNIMFGNWRELVIGYWSGLDLNVDTATLSKSGGHRLVVLQDLDIAVRHAESFAVGYKE